MFYFVFEGNFPARVFSLWTGLWSSGELGRGKSLPFPCYFFPQTAIFSPKQRACSQARGFFALPVWGAYIWRGLYMAGLIFGILRYLDSQLKGPNSSWTHPYGWKLQSLTFDNGHLILLVLEVPNIIYNHLTYSLRVLRRKRLTACRQVM